MRTLLVGVSFLLLALSGTVAAEQPTPGPAPVPVYPMTVPPPIPAPVIVVVPPPFYRPDPYDVWRNYSVNSFGQFRPRVVYRDGRAFYAADGRPVPNPFARPGLWRP
jgi:hypothetical protein